MKKPTKRQVERALALLTSPRQLQYFYEHLHNPEWIGPLNEQGQFNDPPDPYRKGDGTVHPIWEAGRYLVRMASQEPIQVAEIFGKIETFNAQILWDMVKAAKLMPGPQAAELANKISQLLRKDVWVIYSTESAELIKHLTETGETGVALKLADAQYFLRSGDGYGSFRSRIENHWYGNSLQIASTALTKTSTVPTIQWLIRLLKNTVRIHMRSYDVDDNEFNDYSTIWRRAIEDHEQNKGSGIEGDIVVALRKSFSIAIEDGILEISDAIKMLEEVHYLIFHRMVLDVLEEFITDAKEIARQKITDVKLFNDYRYRYEYVKLLRAGFRTVLDDHDRSLILSWIDQGPDMSDFNDVFEGNTGEKPTEEQRSKRIDYWVFERLAWLGDALPLDYQSHYRELCDKFGPPKHPEFSTWSETRSGWTSPKTVKDLENLNRSELTTYLHNWRPNHQGDEEGEFEGLAQTFGAVAEKRVEEFAAAAMEFKVLEPAYIRNLIDAVKNRVKEDPAFEVGPTLELCQWVLEQEDSDADKITQRREKTRWKWTRDTICDFVESICDAGIDTKYREAVFSIIKPLTWGSTKSNYIKEIGDEFHWVSLGDQCLNTARSRAIQALIRYAIWIKNSEVGEDNEQVQSVGFDLLPEVRKLLDEHLDPTIDNTEAVRAMYGYMLTNLSYLDNKWLSENVDQLFPLEGPHERLGWAGWSTYVHYSKIYGGVYDTLQNKYAESTLFLRDIKSKKEFHEHPATRMGEHLAIVYAWGKIELEKESPLSLFFENAPPALRGRVIQSVGQMFRYERKQDNMGREIMLRFQTFWDWYWESLITKNYRAPQKEEVHGFGRWFAWGTMAGEWMLTQLERVLKIDPKIDLEHGVMERMVELADKFPKECFTCADLMVRADAKLNKPWLVRGYRKSLFKVLKSVFDKGDPEDCRKAMKLVHFIGQLSNEFDNFGELYQRYGKTHTKDVED